MADKDKKETVYPPEYAHIEEKVKKVQERVQQLDEQIKNVPANSKPAPRLTPPGFVQPRFFKREERIAVLEQEKAELKDSTFGQVEQDIKDADPRIARLVRDGARENLFPNPIRKMSVQEKNQFGDVPKDMEAAQNLMDTFFTTRQKTDKQTNIKAEKPTPQTTMTAMSARFSQGLSYTRAAEKTDNPVTSSQDRSIDKD